MVIILTLLVSLWDFEPNHLPGGCSQGGDECLQNPPYENEGVLPRDEEVQCWQDDDGVNEQPTNHCNRVHSQLAAHGCDVVHLHDLTSNQEQDTNRGIPEDWLSVVVNL